MASVGLLTFSVLNGLLNELANFIYPWSSSGIVRQHAQNEVLTDTDHLIITPN